MILPDRDHDYFAFASDSFFMENLLHQLQINDLTPADLQPTTRYSKFPAVQKAVSEW